MIFTSYFSNIRNIGDLFPISIALYSPKWYNGAKYNKLSPTFDILHQYKKDGNIESYKIKFKTLLNNLNCSNVVEELYSLSKNKNIVLLCYERPEKFCHRQIVSKWLNNNGFCCEELKNFPKPLDKSKSI